MAKMFDLEERAKIREAREDVKANAAAREREIRNQVAKAIADEVNDHSQKNGKKCTAIARLDEVTLTSLDAREMIIKIHNEKDYDCSYKNMSQLHVAGLIRHPSEMDDKNVLDDILDWYKVISR